MYVYIYTHRQPWIPNLRLSPASLETSAGSFTPWLLALKDLGFRALVGPQNST